MPRPHDHKADSADGRRGIATGNVEAGVVDTQGEACNGGGMTGDGGDGRRQANEDSRMGLDAGRRDHRKPVDNMQQQQDLLEDLVPPTSEHHLPGTGIGFVGAQDDGNGGGRKLATKSLVEREQDAMNGNISRSVDKIGRVVQRQSVFERQALDKTRAKQRERLETGEPQV